MLSCGAYAPVASPGAAVVQRRARSASAALRTHSTPLANSHGGAAWRVCARNKGTGSGGVGQVGADDDVFDIRSFISDINELEAAVPTEQEQLVNVWTFDSATGQVVESQELRRIPKSKKIADVVDRDFSDDELDEEEGEETSGEYDWVTTSSLGVDGRDLEDSIAYLSQLSLDELDAESRAVVEEELEAKLEEKAAKEKRLTDLSTDPPEGKRSTHKRLRIIAGKVASAKLLSPTDLNTRPMMGRVRGAVFSMLTSMCHGYGSVSAEFPAGSRWLDLFAGTGAVGIEGLSRGIAESHFVELDPWVINNCLHKNLEHTRFEAAASVHQQRVETFLQTAETNPRAAGGPFDYISVCPPYDKVSYQELLSALEKSPLVKTGTIIVVEYPRAETETLKDQLGRLEKLKDRAYGRTIVAVYESGADVGVGCTWEASTAEEPAREERKPILGAGRRRQLTAERRQKQRREQKKKVATAGAR